MAARVPFKKVELTPNDVPGAVLTNQEVDDNNTADLKRYLVCRGIQCKNKNKEELIYLVKKASKRNLPIDPQVDGGKWLSKKAREERAADLEVAAYDGDELDSESFNLFPIGGWKKFPSRCIPPFGFSSIHSHLVDTAFIETDECDENDDYAVRFDTKKPLVRGRKFFTSGHIPRDHMYDALSHDQKYCLKAQVLASMEMNTKYCVYIMLGSRGDVVDASCECKASSMGRCSHVAGVLFALEDYTIKYGNQPPSCTSQVCSWNQGRKQKTSNPIYLTQYTGKRDPGRTYKFNPFTEETVDHPQHHALRTIQEYSGPTMGWELLLSFSYEDYVITSERRGELAENVHQLQNALLFGFTEPGEVPGTLEQSNSPAWRQLRSLLITASTIDYFRAARNETMYKKIRDHMWFPKSVSSIAMEYGKTQEHRARTDYMKKTGNKVTECGLWVNPKYRGLGASPDGIVFCRQSNTKGILEIKCPFLLKNHSPEQFDVRLKPKQVSGYFLQKVVDKVTLKKNHKYYRQIQMQMAIVGLAWCDFVVWSAKGIIIERIAFDEQVWTPISDKLTEIHSNIMCPEYFEMRIPRKLEPLCLTDSEN